MATLKVLTRPKFKAWLETRLGKEVGKSRFSGKCPIAKFLMAQPNIDNVWVCHLGININSAFLRYGKEYDVPKWAKAFMGIIDKSHYGARITAKSALKALAAVSR